MGMRFWRIVVALWCLLWDWTGCLLEAWVYGKDYENAHNAEQIHYWRYAIYRCHLSWCERLTPNNY